MELDAFAMELDAFAMELGTFALELVAFALEFIMAIMTPKNNYLSQSEWLSPWRKPTETEEGELVLRAV